MLNLFRGASNPSDIYYLWFFLPRIFISKCIFVFKVGNASLSDDNFKHDASHLFLSHFFKKITAIRIELEQLVKVLSFLRIIPFLALCVPPGGGE
jgi:hypothetical protein